MSNKKGPVKPKFINSKTVTWDSSEMILGRSLFPIPI